MLLSFYVNMLWNMARMQICIHHYERLLSNVSFAKGKLKLSECLYCIIVFTVLQISGYDCNIIIRKKNDDWWCDNMNEEEVSIESSNGSSDDWSEYIGEDEGKSALTTGGWGHLKKVTEALTSALNFLLYKLLKNLQNRMLRKSLMLMLEEWESGANKRMS